MISFILSRALASPLEEVFNVLKKDVESITNETFNVSPQELEAAESSQLSSSIAELSQKVNEEYLRLRKDPEPMEGFLLDFTTRSFSY